MGQLLHADSVVCVKTGGLLPLHALDVGVSR